ILFLVSSSILVLLRARRTSASFIHGSERPRPKQPVVIQIIWGRRPGELLRALKNSVGVCTYLSRTQAKASASPHHSALNWPHSRGHLRASPAGTITTTGFPDPRVALTTEAITASAT